MTSVIPCLAAVLLVTVIVSNVQANERPSFIGKPYKLSKTCDNFDEFMKALGVGWFTRSVGATQYPTVTVTYDDKTGYYTMTTSSTFKTQKLKFKLGEEFDEETPDGRNVKAVITIDGNKMLHVQKGSKGTKIERIFGPDKMTAILQFGRIKCTRVYKLQN